MYDVLADRNPVRMWGEGSGYGSLGLDPGLVVLGGGVRWMEF